MFQISDMLLRFETRARQRRLILRIEAKFRTFWPPVKISEIFPCNFLATPIGPNHWYTFDGAPQRRLAAIGALQKKSSEVKYKGLSDYRRSGLNKSIFQRRCFSRWFLNEFTSSVMMIMTMVIGEEASCNYSSAFKCICTAQMTPVSEPVRYDQLLQLLSLDFLVRYTLKHAACIESTKKTKACLFAFLCDSGAELTYLLWVYRHSYQE